MGWGRSYLSQLLNKQKALRFEQVLLILKVVGVEPETFFADVYQLGESRRPRRCVPRAAPTPLGGLGPPTLRGELRRLKLLLDGLVSVLQRKALIRASDLARAVEEDRHKP